VKSQNLKQLPDFTLSFKESKRTSWIHCRSSYGYMDFFPL